MAIVTPVPSTPQHQIDPTFQDFDPAAAKFGSIAGTSDLGQNLSETIRSKGHFGYGSGEVSKHKYQKSEAMVRDLFNINPDEVGRVPGSTFLSGGVHLPKYKPKPLDPSRLADLKKQESAASNYLDKLSTLVQTAKKDGLTGVYEFSNLPKNVKGVSSHRTCNIVRDNCNLLQQLKNETGYDNVLELLLKLLAEGFIDQNKLDSFVEYLGFFKDSESVRNELENLGVSKEIANISDNFNMAMDLFLVDYIKEQSTIRNFLNNYPNDYENQSKDLNGKIVAELGVEIYANPDIRNKFEKVQAFVKNLGLSKQSLDLLGRNTSGLGKLNVANEAEHLIVFSALEVGAFIKQLDGIDIVACDYSPLGYRGYELLHQKDLQGYRKSPNIAGAFEKNKNYDETAVVMCDLFSNDLVHHDLVAEAEYLPTLKNTEYALTVFATSRKLDLAYNNDGTGKNIRLVKSDNSKTKTLFSALGTMSQNASSVRVNRHGFLKEKARNELCEAVTGEQFNRLLSAYGLDFKTAGFTGTRELETAHKEADLSNRTSDMWQYYLYLAQLNNLGDDKNAVFNVKNAVRLATKDAISTGKIAGSSTSSTSGPDGSRLTYARQLTSSKDIKNAENTAGIKQARMFYDVRNGDYVAQQRKKAEGLTLSQVLTKPSESRVADSLGLDPLNITDKATKNQVELKALFKELDQKANEVEALQGIVNDANELKKDIHEELPNLPAEAKEAIETLKDEAVADYISDLKLRRLNPLFRKKQDNEDSRLGFDKLVEQHKIPKKILKEYHNKKDAVIRQYIQDDSTADEQKDDQYVTKVESSIESLENFGEKTLELQAKLSEYGELLQKLEALLSDCDNGKGLDKILEAWLAATDGFDQLPRIVGMLDDSLLSGKITQQQYDVYMSRVLRKVGEGNLLHGCGKHVNAFIEAKKQLDSAQTILKYQAAYMSNNVYMSYDHAKRLSGISKKYSVNLDAKAADDLLIERYSPATSAAHKFAEIDKQNGDLILHAFNAKIKSGDAGVFITEADLDKFKERLMIEAKPLPQSEQGLTTQPLIAQHSDLFNTLTDEFGVDDANELKKQLEQDAANLAIQRQQARDEFYPTKIEDMSFDDFAKDISEAAKEKSFLAEASKSKQKLLKQIRDFDQKQQLKHYEQPKPESDSELEPLSDTEAKDKGVFKRRTAEDETPISSDTDVEIETKPKDPTTPKRTEALVQTEDSLDDILHEDIPEIEETQNIEDVKLTIVETKSGSETTSESEPEFEPEPVLIIESKEKSDQPTTTTDTDEIPFDEDYEVVPKPIKQPTPRPAKLSEKLELEEGTFEAIIDASRQISPPPAEETYYERPKSIAESIQQDAERNPIFIDPDKRSDSFKLSQPESEEAQRKYDSYVEYRKDFIDEEKKEAEKKEKAQQFAQKSIPTTLSIITDEIEDLEQCTPESIKPIQNQIIESTRKVADIAPTHDDLTSYIDAIKDKINESEIDDPDTLLEEINDIEKARQAELIAEEKQRLQKHFDIAKHINTCQDEVDNLEKLAAKTVFDSEQAEEEIPDESRILYGSEQNRENIEQNMQDVANICENFNEVDYYFGVLENYIQEKVPQETKLLVDLHKIKNDRKLELIDEALKIVESERKDRDEQIIGESDFEGNYSPIATSDTDTDPDEQYPYDRNQGHQDFIKIHGDFENRNRANQGIVPIDKAAGYHSDLSDSEDDEPGDGVIKPTDRSGDSGFEPSGTDPFQAGSLPEVSHSHDSSTEDFGLGQTEPGITPQTEQTADFVSKIDDSDSLNEEFDENIEAFKGVNKLVIEAADSQATRIQEAAQLIQSKALTGEVFSAEEYQTLSTLLDDSSLDEVKEFKAAAAELVEKIEATLKKGKGETGTKDPDSDHVSPWETSHIEVQQQRFEAVKANSLDSDGDSLTSVRDKLEQSTKVLATNITNPANVMTQERVEKSVTDIITEVNEKGEIEPQGALVIEVVACKLICAIDDLQPPIDLGNLETRARELIDDAAKGIQTERHESQEVQPEEIPVLQAEETALDTVEEVQTKKPQTSFSEHQQRIESGIRKYLDLRGEYNKALSEDSGNIETLESSMDSELRALNGNIVSFHEDELNSNVSGSETEISEIHSKLAQFAKAVTEVDHDQKVKLFSDDLKYQTRLEDQQISLETKHRQYNDDRVNSKLILPELSSELKKSTALVGEVHSKTIYVVNQLQLLNGIYTVLKGDTDEDIVATCQDVLKHNYISVYTLGEHFSLLRKLGVVANDVIKTLDNKNTEVFSEFTDEEGVIRREDDILQAFNKQLERMEPNLSDAVSREVVVEDAQAKLGGKDSVLQIEDLPELIALSIKMDELSEEAPVRTTLETHTGALYTSYKEFIDFKLVSTQEKINTEIHELCDQSIAENVDPTITAINDYNDKLEAQVQGLEHGTTQLEETKPEKLVDYFPTLIESVNENIENIQGMKDEQEAILQQENILREKLTSLHDELVKIDGDDADFSHIIGNKRREFNAAADKTQQLISRSNIAQATAPLYTTPENQAAVRGFRLAHKERLAKIDEYRQKLQEFETKEEEHYEQIVNLEKAWKSENLSANVPELPVLEEVSGNKIAELNKLILEDIVDKHQQVENAFKQAKDPFRTKIDFKVKRESLRDINKTIDSNETADSNETTEVEVKQPEFKEYRLKSVEGIVTGRMPVLDEKGKPKPDWLVSTESQSVPRLSSVHVSTPKLAPDVVSSSSASKSSPFRSASPRGDT